MTEPSLPPPTSLHPPPPHAPTHLPAPASVSPPPLSSPPPPGGGGGKDWSKKKSAVAIRESKGVAYGVVRSRCKIESCTCSQFISHFGGGTCKAECCGHFATDHVYFGDEKSRCSMKFCPCIKYEKWPKEDISFPPHHSPSSPHSPPCHHCGHSKEHHTDLPPWQIHPEQIRLVKQIGSGQFGMVYLGNLWGTEVAVKKVRKNLRLLGESDVEMLYNEIYFLSRLNHPNLVSFMGASTDNDNFMIITEFAQKGSLFDNLQSERVISWDTLLSYALDIARGMNYLHHNNVVHRDLKSDNILVTSHDVCKIADFGLSAIIPQSGRKMRYGTPFWMAPEVVSYKLFTPHSDVFSYGIILCELLSRQFPYTELGLDDEEAIMQGVLLKSIRPQLPSWTPNKWKELCDDCWNQNGERRPTFDAVVERLAEIKRLFPDVVPVIGERKKLIIQEEDSVETEPDTKPQQQQVAILPEERAQRKEATRERKKHQRMLEFFMNLVRTQRASGEWNTEDMRFDKAWNLVGGMNMVKCTPSLSDDLHITSVCVSFMNWIVNYAEHQESEALVVNETSMVGKNEFMTKQVEIDTGGLKNKIINVAYKYPKESLGLDVPAERYAEAARRYLRERMGGGGEGKDASQKVEEEVDMLLGWYEKEVTKVNGDIFCLNL